MGLSKHNKLWALLWKISVSGLLRNSVSLSKALGWEKVWSKYQWHDSKPYDFVSEGGGVARCSRRASVSPCLLVSLGGPRSSCLHHGYSTDMIVFPVPLPIRQFRKVPPTQACAIRSYTHTINHFNQETLSALTFRSSILCLDFFPRHWRAYF